MSTIPSTSLGISRPLFASLLLLFFLPLQAISQTTYDEQSILLKLKQDWKNQPPMDSWKSSLPFCNWTGITCDNGSVTGISFGNWNINGPIPPIICNLSNLNHLDLTLNYITGEFPTFLYNCSKLVYLDLSQNYFVGRIPDDIHRLSRLTYLNLEANNFTGDIPAAIGRLSELKTLSLVQNLFNGTFPPEIGDLSNLEFLQMAYNGFLPSRLPVQFGRLKKLTLLWMASTNLIGEIPESIGNITELQHLDLSVNNMNGSIPGSVFLLNKLKNLYLYNNKFSGEIPRRIECLSLNNLDISINKLTGPIPEDFGKLNKLQYLFMYYNRLSGEIPASIGRLPALKDIRLFNNNFTGVLPPDLGLYSKLISLEVSNNRLTGKLPDHLCAGGVLTGVSLFSNHLSGEVSASLGNCNSLTDIQLYNNGFSGEFPANLWSSINLTTLMISNNSFSGKLPSKLAWNLTRLEISYNRFSANVFLNLRVCTSQPQESQKLSPRLLAIIITFSGLVFLVALLSALLLVRDCRRRKHGRDLAKWKLTSFQRLAFTESIIVSNLTDRNLIGGGGSGKVYRVPFGQSGGEVVAVKRIWNNGKLEEKLEKEFEAEVKILGIIRHSNIVKLMCCICSEKSRLLVYEFMENGSLDRWLHGKKRGLLPSGGSIHDAILDWPRRLQIAIGAANGLSYMHHDCRSPIIHRDVKSSNILLDSDFSAKIADFGLAKMLIKRGDPESMSAVAGSYGYFAPGKCYYNIITQVLHGQF
uniref:Protein kinase domain-containing protein n=1 Tax=Nelumbo nucifera TaxID=4432 RepID=A0A822ZM30_NELNU|nr:TPA_asm: hypothetical protein HUJ06_002810 [Nelumbo nucifera]